MWLLGYKAISAAGNWMFQTRWCKKSNMGQLTRLPKGGSNSSGNPAEEFDYYFRLAPHVDVESLPDEVEIDITTGNIIGLSFGPSLGFEIFTFWWMGGDSFTVGTAANGVHRAYQSMIHYEKLYHSIRIEIDPNGASIENKEYIMSVFYKP